MKYICGIHRKGNPECKQEFVDLYELLCHINNAHVHKSMNDPDKVLLRQMKEKVR